MDHQVFEQWLFSDEPLSPDQSQALRAHLEICESCRNLSMAWSDVRNLFEEVPDLEPSPGFADRWRVYQEGQIRHERYYQNQRRSRITLSITSLGAVLFLSLMVYQILATVGTPMQLLFMGIFQVTAFISKIIAIKDIMITFLDIAFGLVSPAYWAGIAAGLGLLSLLWLISLRQVFQHRRITT
jgi:predicted anti-sigma-YlaC factor YlaD